MAWPAESQWLELVKGGVAIQDNESDANGGVNVVPSDGSHAAAFIYNDGSYLYYRLRLDADPTQGGNGVFAQFGWGFEIDTDQNADDYEWLIMCDGISSPEVISLRENTDKTGVGDPSDKAEFVAAEYPLVGNHQLQEILPTHPEYTAVNGDPDYFLDFRLPYSVFKSITGITDNTIIRYFAGSSRSTNNLTDNGADLVAGSTLYEMASDYITPFGTLPTSLLFYDGTISFVDSLSGFNDVAVAGPGDTLYLRVDDADQSSDTNPAGVIRVELSAPSGDVEVVILSATGVSGKYTGSITTTAAGDNPGDGILQVSPDETITVTYLDAIAADRSQSVPRSDTLLMTATGTDVGVTKTSDKTVAQEGETVTFTIETTNYGPSAVSGLEITDQLPTGFSFVSATPSLGAYDFASGIWTVGALARYQVETLTLTATADIGTSGSTLVNTATITALNQNDGNPVNDSYSVAVFIGGTDIRITKMVSNSAPTEGELIIYTIRAVNLGPNDATGIEVTDLLPAGVSYVSDTPSQGSYNNATGLWAIGVVNNGSAAQLLLRATVDVGSFGSLITNTATLTVLDQPDTDPGNNSAATDILVGSLDLAISKTVDSLAPSENDTINYTIALINNGPNDATGIEITDLLPTGVTYVSNTPSQGSYNNVTGLWNVGTVASGISATLGLTVTVDTGTAGQSIINTATITALDQPDSDSGNDSDSITIKIDGTDLQLTKTVDNPTPNEGDTIIYTVTLTNNGPNPATNIDITDILPTGVSYDSHIGSAGNYDAGKQNSTWVWSHNSLAIAASETLAITATVDAGTAGSTIVNVAFITHVDQEDPIDGNNVGSVEIAVDGTDLAISKVVDNPAPNVGDNIVYTITLTNNGPSNATNIVITDFLPPELQYDSDDSGGSYDQLSGLWSVAALANGVNTVLNITVSVLDGNNGLVITNTASITAADQGDPLPDNNSDSADINVSATDIEVTKVVDNPTPGEGSTITYTVTASNIGANAASGIEIEDNLPAGVTFVSATSSQGNFAAGLWLLGNLASGTSATLDIVLTVNPFTAGSTITNTATLTALDQIDSNPANDISSVDIVPLALPSITVLKSADLASANPGQIITYTVTVLNTGSSPATTVQVDDTLSQYVAMILDFDGTTPPYEAFDFVDGGSGLTFDESTDLSYFDSGGPYIPNFPAGEDGAVVSWQLNMTGSFNAGSQFTLYFKVRVK